MDDKMTGASRTSQKINNRLLLCYRLFWTYWVLSILADFLLDAVELLHLAGR